MDRFRSIDLMFGNSPQDLMLAAAIAAGVLLVVWGVRSVALWKFRNSSVTETRIDDVLVDVLTRTKLYLLFFPALFLGVRALDNVPSDLFRLIRALATITMAAQIALWATGFVEGYIRRYRRTRLESDPDALTTLNVFRIGAIAFVWVTAILSGLHHLGFNISTLIAGLGIGGVAVALATQNILGDLFASLSIVIDKPFVIGDAVVVGDTAGTVEHVGLKSTLIRSASGEQVVVGNADLLKSRIHNFRRMSERRVVFRIGVTYDTPAETLEALPGMIKEIVEAQKSVRFDRTHLIGFGESALDFETAYWVLSADAVVSADIHQAVCLEIIRRFERERIRFAFPTRNVFVTQA